MRDAPVLTMKTDDAADCGEWSLYARGTALAVAKKVNMTYDSSVLFEDGMCFRGSEMESLEVSVPCLT